MNPLLLTLIIAIFINAFAVNMEHNWHRVRNQYLRFYIATKKTHSPAKLPTSVSPENHPIPTLILRSGIVQTKHFICEFWHTIGFNIPTRKLVASTKEKTNQIYNSVLSKYHDAQIAYYSLPQEDRDLIEQIINLHF